MKENCEELNGTQDQSNQATIHSKRYHRIRNCIFLSGLSIFAQLYLFQPMLAELCHNFLITPATSSLAVSCSTVGMAVGLFLFAFTADAIPRHKLMSASLVLSSIMSIAAAVSMNFPLLLVISFFKGVLLSGVSAVALAYLTEEVSPAIIGLAISLYLSGNTIGGMSGRVIASLVSGWSNWHIADLTIGIGSLILGLIFMKHIPQSQNFSPVKVNFHEKLSRMKSFMHTPLFLGMYITGALVMGIFVSIYNYLSFVLSRPEFGLPHYVIALIFLMYSVGVIGSIVTGKLSDKMSPSSLLIASIVLMIPGLLLMRIMNLGSIIFGLGLITISFFSAHTMASRIVSMHAHEGKTSATSLYWLFYYIGSSLAGWATGIALAHSGWKLFIDITLLMAVAALGTSAMVTRPYLKLQLKTN